jgi:hypothetical protein
MHRIVSAVVGLILLAAPAAASDGKEAAAQAAEAARGLQQYAAEVAAAGNRIDFAKGPAADYFQRVFDQASFAGLPAPAAADMPWLMEWFGAVRNANYTILYFGADPKRLAALSQEQIARNLADYEDQFAAATAFMHKMFPRVMTTALDFMNALPERDRNSPVRQEGLGKMRNGYVEAVEGSLTFLAAGGAKTQNIRTITAALRENAETWSKLVAPADRGRLAKLIAMARDKAGDDQSSENLRAMLTTLGAK